jgi:two-component system, sensor histidine kinase and response regulator
MNVKAKILVVDDEPDIALILKLFLEESGFQVSSATDGGSCFSMMAEEQFTLVLLDINLPDMSGIDVLKKIMESNSDVPVLMMTGNGSESMAVQCMRIGAHDYFPKPFSLEDVLHRVEQALAYREMAVARKRLEQEKKDFVYMLSHDLKNPITAVVGSIDIIREARLGPVNPEQVEYLQSAIDCCNEVVTMIDNMIDIHRMESGLMQMNIRPCDPSEIIRSDVSKCTMIARREGISLVAEIGTQIPQVAVDRIVLSRIVSNLLGNAIKFTPEEGLITLKCSSLPGTMIGTLNPPGYISAETLLQLSNKQLLYVSIKDNGLGIPKEDQENIFKRFVQSKRSDREHGGAGLGLAYCKLTIEQLGGVIWVESELDQGSEFIFLLPCIDQN